MQAMRPVDHLVLASYQNPRKYSVLFVDGVEVKVWASNDGQARIIGKLKRRSVGLGPEHISSVAVENV